ncbi:MAG TPA: lipid-A-disaccharide synthase [Methylocystis sp.]|nr:lipid-A-disaccharide synthase [Methylocystis sp.]
MTKLFLIAGEASGDQLGGLLMRALRAQDPTAAFAGVGGEQMACAGLDSLFPISDLAVMGLAPLARLPKLISRLNQTVAAILADPPECLVLIDAPDFTHRVARRVRAKAPHIPIVDYVSPTVWAWRPWRARRMRAYIDLVLAVLPFEPAAYRRLSGPPCVYVGHPLIEALPALQPRGEERRKDDLLLVLPGSREAEVKRMLPPYLEAAAILAEEKSDLDVAIPVAPRMAGLIESLAAQARMRPRLLSQDEKHAAFRAARAALVTSGVATLELALAQTPMVVAYKVSFAERLLKFLVTTPHFALPNLILERRSIPELFQNEASPQSLAGALGSIFDEGPPRLRQAADLVELRERILDGGANPSAHAARLVLERAGAAKSRGRE